jgi:hypothetical protein
MARVQYKSYEDLLEKKNARLQKIKAAEQEHEYLQKLHEALQIIINDFDKLTYAHNERMAKRRNEFLQDMAKGTQFKVEDLRYLIDIKKLAKNINYRREDGLEKMAKDKHMVTRINWILRDDFQKEEFAMFGAYYVNELQNS